MIATLISIIIYLIIAGIIWYAVRMVINALPIVEPIKTVINALLIVVLALIVLYAVLPLVPHGPLVLR